MTRGPMISVVAVLASWLAAGPGAAKDVPTVTPTAWPAIEGFDPDGSASISGIACGPERSGRRGCVLVDDETRHLRFATLAGQTFTLGAEMAVLDKTAVDAKTGATVKNKEADLEAVSRDGDTYWVFGSHSTRRKPPEGEIKCPLLSGRRHVYRFTVDPKTEAPSFAVSSKTAAPEIRRIDDLPAVLATLPELSAAVDAEICAGDGGFNIEGGTVAGGHMFLGLRAPLLDGGAHAAVVELDAEALAHGDRPKPTLHRLALGQGYGVRDLVTVAGGHLVLAGASASDDDPSRPPSVLWFWPGGDAAAVKVAVLGGVPADAKPEGMTVLETTASGWRILVVCDGAEGGAPLEYRVDRP